jgi:hypothetical protein
VAVNKKQTKKQGATPKKGKVLYKKGESGNPRGRPKGSKNKISGDLRAQILAVANKLTTKKKGLLQCAEQDPAWFFEKIYSKIIPRPPIEVEVDAGKNLMSLVAAHLSKNDSSD